MQRIYCPTLRRLSVSPALTLRRTVPGPLIAAVGAPCRRRLATRSAEPSAPTASTSGQAVQTPSDASDKPKTKAKPTASLRRAASASLPIRANPTPTRGAIKPVFTVSTAERYLLDKLVPKLPPTAKMLPDDDFEEAWWIPGWGADGAGEVFVFRNGSYVCWGLAEEEALKFGDEVIKTAVDAEVGPLSKLETEELEFVTDPSEHTRLQGDLIILGDTPQPRSTYTPIHPPSSSGISDRHVLARYAFSQALARSSALSALESSLDAYLISVSRLPETLSATGRPGLGRKQLIKKLGELMRFRQGVNLNRENFHDTPDFYWAEPELEGYFDSVSRALEIRQRMNSVNAKITYAAETQEVLRQLLTDATGHRMEIIIIALIAVEVVIALIRDGPELWHLGWDLWHMLVRGSDEHKKERVHAA